MKIETSTSFLITVGFSVVVIICAYVLMAKTGRIWGMYAIPALYAGAAELVIGMVLVFSIRTRFYGAGILMGGLFTLLIGGSICSGWIRI